MFFSAAGGNPCSILGVKVLPELTRFFKSFLEKTSLYDDITPVFEDHISLLMKGGDIVFESEDFKSFTREALYLSRKHCPKEKLEDITHLLTVLEKKVLRRMNTNVVTVVDGASPEGSSQSSEGATGLSAVVEEVAGLSALLEAQTRPPSPTNLLTPQMSEKNIWGAARTFDTNSIDSEESHESTTERLEDEIAISGSRTPVKPGAVFTGNISEK